MIWVDATKESPTAPGHYFCMNPRYGRMVMGWNGDWGESQHYHPVFWLKDDGFPNPVDIESLQSRIPDSPGKLE